MTFAGEVVVCPSKSIELMRNFDVITMLETQSHVKSREDMVLNLIMHYLSYPKVMLIYFD